MSQIRRQRGCRGSLKVALTYDCYTYLGTRVFQRRERLQRADIGTTPGGAISVGRESEGSALCGDERVREVRAGRDPDVIDRALERAKPLEQQQRGLDPADAFRRGHQTDDRPHTDHDRRRAPTRGDD